jgi:hypothetical protein
MQTYGYIIVHDEDEDGHDHWTVKRVNIEKENKRQQKADHYQNIYPDRDTPQSLCNHWNI